MPTISIIMTVYNRERYVGDAIASVLAQTYRDFELLVWDDGSTDRSVDIAYQYAKGDLRVKVVAAPHQGIAPSLKSAIASTSAPYLGWVDSDDLLAPSALEETVAILSASPNTGMIYTSYQVIDELGQVRGQGTRCQILYSKDQLLVDFMTFHFRLMRRNIYEQVGGIDPSFQWAEDYDLCLKISEITQIYHLPHPLYFYRCHSDNITNNQIEAIRYSAIAVEQALKRRGLNERYRLEVKLVNSISHFKLVPKRSVTSPTNGSAQEMPLVSIIIPCYNAAARIESCLQSCLQQTYPRIEILVVDNNSTDGSIEILQKYAQTLGSQLRVFSCLLQGANFARNAGFAQSKGDYIQWLDADDEIAPTKIALQVAALESNQNYNIAYGDWEWYFYDNQNLTAKLTFGGQQYEDMLLQLLIDNWRPPHTYLLRQKAVAKLHSLGAWNPQTPVGMDREYFTLAALQGFKFLYVPQTFVRYYRWSPNQVTQRISYQERVSSCKTMFGRFYLVAKERSQPLSQVHQFLLQQNWELWQPAFVLERDSNTFWLSHPQRRDRLAINRQAANVAQALLKSKGAGTLEDKARQVVQQMRIRIILRFSQSSPSKSNDFALLSSEISKLLGMVAVESDRKENADLWELNLATLQTKPNPWLLNLPLFAPLFGEQRLVVYLILEQLRQQGWLKRVSQHLVSPKPQKIPAYSNRSD